MNCTSNLNKNITYIHIDIHINNNNNYNKTTAEMARIIVTKAAVIKLVLLLLFVN